VVNLTSWPLYPREITDEPNPTGLSVPFQKWYSRLEEEKNLLLLSGIEPGSSRPENSHGTDRAIPDAGVTHAIV